MYDVATLGSVNIDLVDYVSRSEITALEERHEWFPRAGETVRIDDVPAAMPPGEPQHFLGGKGANQAVAAARANADSALFGTVGTDAADYGVRETLRRRGVDVRHLDEADEGTGKAYVFVDGQGENWISVLANANAATDEAYLDREYDRLRSADVLLLQNEIPRSTMESLLAALADESDRPTVVFNPAPVEGVEPLLTRPAVDVLSVNRTEYEALAESIEGFDGTVIRTNGGRDVVVEGDVGVDGDVGARVSPPSADPVDTTGAGDVFNGYLAARLAADDPLREAVEVATVAASLSTRTEGAQEAMPTLEAVREFFSRATPGRDA